MPKSTTLWNRLKANGDCWEVTNPGPKGYGFARLNGVMMHSHRAAYLMMVGEIPAGLELDHLCRNRACCNPDHLDPVPHEVNLARIPKKTHCKYGHEFTDDNTRVYTAKDGRVTKFCKRCDRIRDKKRTEEGFYRKRSPKVFGGEA